MSKSAALYITVTAFWFGLRALICFSRAGLPTITPITHTRYQLTFSGLTMVGFFVWAAIANGWFV